MKKPIRMFFILAVLAACVVHGQELGKRLPKGGIYYPLETGYANLRLEAGKPNIYFLDKEGKLIPPTLPEATLFYENVARADREGPLVMTSTGTHLTAVRSLRPPLRFSVRVILRDPANESRNILLGRTTLTPDNDSGDGGKSSGY